MEPYIEHTVGKETSGIQGQKVKVESYHTPLTEEKQLAGEAIAEVIKPSPFPVMS